jgi:hypothetical protein
MEPGNLSALIEATDKFRRVQAVPSAGA